MPSRMTLYHVSPYHTRASIAARGIDPSYSRGAPWVWLVAPSRVLWSIDHVRRRHGVHHVDVWRVVVPRAHAVRRARGVWTIARVVPASRLPSYRVS